ncbi:MAG: LamG domain-containing protein [Lachnoclostridium sp.]|nr:LamG domain-containing protein [Lachnoclostridium sp.]
MKKVLSSLLISAVALTAVAATPQTEFLDRGVVALKTDTGVFVSWRSLATDASTTTFDVYRNNVKINNEPISAVTSFTDPAGEAGAIYEVRASGITDATATGSCAAWDAPYKKIHLNRPEGGQVGVDKDNLHSYTYSPDDLSVGDVDGDGVYELFVKWVPSDAKDSSNTGFTGPTIIDCYKQDGTFLWRVDLGHNIRSGNHYTQFMVYDFDGDGSAEMICKTAPGAKDGKGNWILMGDDQPTDDYRNYTNNPNKALGHVIGGAEYLTCFSGKTGENLSTIAYKPGYEYGKSVWGDEYGNRSDRYLAGVAYLDGQRPTAIFARGYYRAAFVWAVNFRDGKLQEYWFHESNVKGKGLWGEGAHSLTVGDVDNDGKDEIVYGAACLDNDGTVLYRTNPNTDNTEGHGDALHLAKMLPDREGLQVFMPHEETESKYPFDTEMRDARTGEIIFSKAQSGKDIGRGIAANVSASFPGYEYWAASDANVYSYGKAIASNRPPINFRIYWDGDLLDELLDGTQISKPEPDFSKINTIMAFESYSNAASCNGTKATPNLQADLFGDWREEVILHDGNTNSDLLVFTTTIPTEYKLTCLMQDHQYRMAIAWQNTAYNQPPHLSYSPEDTYETNAAITVVEGAASQVINKGDAIEALTVRAWRATGLSCSELPEGLTWNYNATEMTGTLAGTPAVEGEYNITISTTGAADDKNASMNIRIKVIKTVKLTTMAYFSCDAPGATLLNQVYGQAEAAGEGTPEQVEGKKGNAVSLNGKNYYVQAPYDALNYGADDFTIEMWMKSADDAAYIFHHGTNTRNEATGATGNWIGLELKNDVLYFAIDDDVTKCQAYVKEAGKWFDNEWHHVVMVRDTYASTLYLYVDGEQVAAGQDNTGALNCGVENLILGNFNVSFDNPFTGALDEIYIYQGAMSAEKVAERYASSGSELAYYPLDEVAETTPNLVYGSATAEGGVPTAIEGVKAGAAEFAGGSYYTQAAYDAIQLGESDFTVSMWLKSTDDDAYIFFKGSHSANADLKTTGNWMGLERKNGYLCFSIDDDATKTDCKLADASDVFDGRWHHVACVRNHAEKTLHLYVDGVERATTADKTGALADNNEALLLGISDETSRVYDGALDEFTIFPLALSADAVKSAYEEFAAASIESVLVDAAVRSTIVDAMTGRLIRSVSGNSIEQLVDGIRPGVYVIILENGTSFDTYKYVKR